MKNKQIIGLILAGVIFITAGIVSVFTKKITEHIFEKSTQDVDFLLDSDTNISLPMENFIGIVNVEGTIQDVGSSNAFTTVSYDHQNTLRYIDAMIDSSYNKGVLLRVDSPGGTVYHSDELYLKLMEYKEITGRPIWAYMESQACSGGYYVCMAADWVAANRNAWTGSIGVIISYYNYSGLFKELGIEEINITSGRNKAMGSSGKKLTDEQKEIMQSLVDESYIQFLNIVAEGRNMEVDDVRTFADGRLFTPQQALSYDLIDEISTYEEFKQSFFNEVGSAYSFYQPSFAKQTIFSPIFSALKEYSTKSDAQILTEFLDQEGNGVPLYYAGNR